MRLALLRAFGQLAFMGITLSFIHFFAPAVLQPNTPQSADATSDVLKQNPSSVNHMKVVDDGSRRFDASHDGT